MAAGILAPEVGRLNGDVGDEIVTDGVGVVVTPFVDVERLHGTFAAVTPAPSVGETLEEVKGCERPVPDSVLSAVLTRSGVWLCIRSLSLISNMPRSLSDGLTCLSLSA